MKLKEKIEFAKYLKNLDKRMIEIDESMNLSKAADVYGECVCKMNGWPVETRCGGYSYHFKERNVPNLRNKKIKSPSPTLDLERWCDETEKTIQDT